jgi:hypothetical protein
MSYSIVRVLVLYFLDIWNCHADDLIKVCWTRQNGVGKFLYKFMRDQNISICSVERNFYGFKKGDQSNLTTKELKAYKIIAKQLFAYIDFQKS